jgi:hypothetical protein
MSIVLILHSLWRWVVLLLAVAAIIKGFMGWFGQQRWQALDDRLGLFYTIAYDIQFLLGLILLIGLAVMSGLGRIGMEHALVMFIGAAVVHITRSRAKKAATDTAKHQTTAVGFLVSLLLVIVGIIRVS